jgi:hypothetical protein
MCFVPLIPYQVMRMRLRVNDREESPTRWPRQLHRFHQQTMRFADDDALRGPTEMMPAQKSL